MALEVLAVRVDRADAEAVRRHAARTGTTMTGLLRPAIEAVASQAREAEGRRA